MAGIRKNKGVMVTGAWVSGRVLVTGKRRLRWVGAVEEGIARVVVRKMLWRPSRQAMELKGSEVRETSS